MSTFPLTEGPVSKGGTNPPNTSDIRPPAPQGSGGLSKSIVRPQAEAKMSDNCIPGTERTFTSFHFWMNEEWLQAALQHAQLQPEKRCSLVLALKFPGEAPLYQYKVVDGIGGLETMVGPGDWEPIIRNEFQKPRGKDD